MPELPEVETVRRGIESDICGKTIHSAQVRRHDLRVKVPDDLAQRMRGKFIKSLKRRGKYIIFELDGKCGEVAILHLGMSGRVHIYNSDEARSYHPRKHDHIILKMDDGSLLAYEDPRRFGLFYLSEGKNWEEKPPFSTMGPEPLEASWDGGVLYEAIKGRKAPIKSLLLDQRVVAGLGNIYVCEALHAVGVNPKLKGNKLAKAKYKALTKAIKEVLLRAIKAGGSTLRDYQKTDGSLGYFQHSFRVYDCEGELCMKKGCSGIIARITQGGRSSFYCPVCQK